MTCHKPVFFYSFFFVVLEKYIVQEIVSYGVSWRGFSAQPTIQGLIEIVGEDWRLDTFDCINASTVKV